MFVNSNLRRVASDVNLSFCPFKDIAGSKTEFILEKETTCSIDMLLSLVIVLILPVDFNCFSSLPKRPYYLNNTDTYTKLPKEQYMQISIYIQYIYITMDIHITC